MSMLDFEVGDVVFWLRVRDKNVPLNIYRKEGEWIYQLHTTHELSDDERILIDGFTRERLHEMYETWKPHMKPRLDWKCMKDTH